MADPISTQMTNEKTVMTSSARTSMLAGPELLVIKTRRQKHDQELHHRIHLALGLSLNVNFYFHPPIIKTLNSLLL